jgi:branched-chain amino acid transport system ATP-binding protein
MSLSSTASKSIGDLPYGQQKLVGVARALMNDAKCLLLDEPMAGVEGQSYETMQKIVRDVAASGVAVCVVEHNVAFIRDLCDEAVFMFQGRILARGSVADLIANPQLTELYFGH